MVKINGVSEKKTGRLKGWRTLTFNGLASVLPLLDIVGQIAAVPQMEGIVPPQYYPYYAGAVLIGNALLRSMTNTPVGQK